MLKNVKYKQEEGFKFRTVAFLAFNKFSSRPLEIFRLRFNRPENLTALKHLIQLWIVILEKNAALMLLSLSNLMVY